jgi:hypothetical protein
VDIVSLNVTVQDAGAAATDLDQKSSRSSRTASSRRSRSSTAASSDRLSLLLDSSASMEDKLEELQSPPRASSGAKPNDIAQVIDFDSRVEIRQGSPETSRAEAAIGKTSPADRLAAQCHLHRAKELKKVKAVSEEDVRRRRRGVLGR